MQVSHIETSNTHAVIGGGKARAFKMSQTAEFFTVLSDTLYRDKKRAVVREVLCNAWDAHIMVGKTDVPVEVSLTVTELTIKDFGPGIHDSKIEDIYCTYGNSTKVSDDSQTGGFGLGSKAPFAYSDHLTVTSCHKGAKTIYAISRGGKETKGVPDLRAMVSVPTDESGLTVTIPLKSAEDMREFEKIICDVAKNGGMKVKLNDRVIKHIDYTEAKKSGFLVTSRDQNEEASVYVLYGTVIYPIVSTDAAVKTAVERLNVLINPNRYRHADSKAILLAEPGSIGITPSRESLSFTDQTIETITGLCDRMARQVIAMIPAAQKALAKSNTAKAAKEYNFALHKTISNTVLLRAESNRFATTPFEIAKWSVGHDDNSWVEDRIQQVALINAFPQHRGVIRQVIKQGGSAKHDIHNRIVRRTMIRIGKRADTLDRMFLVEATGHDGLRALPTRGGGNILADLKKVCVIGQSRAEVVGEIRVMRKSWSSETYICAAIPRAKPKDRARVRAEAEKLGFEVHEITVAPPVVKKIKREADKFIDLNTFQVSGSGFMADSTLEAPEYFLRVNATIFQIRESNWFCDLRNLVIEQFPKVAIVRSDAEVKRVKKAGAVDVLDVIFKDLKKQVRSKSARYGIAISQTRVESGTYKMRAVKIIWDLLEKFPELHFDLLPSKGIDRSVAMAVRRKWVALNVVPTQTLQLERKETLAAIQNTVDKEFKDAWIKRQSIEENWPLLRFVNPHSLNDMTIEQARYLIRALKQEPTITGDTE